MGFYHEKVFPRVLDILTPPQLDEIRDRLVANASGHVLEIGSGTGANFLSYTHAVTSLTTIEPNPGMNRLARRRIKYLEFPVDTREIRCENLPMKDESFDCAVSSFTLCSLTELEDSLREIYRALKPNGRLLFLEHGRGDSRQVVRWQDRVAPLQRLLCDGCRLDREIDKVIAQAGFAIGALSTYYLRKVPRTHGYIYEGYATKPG